MIFTVVETCWRGQPVSPASCLRTAGKLFYGVSDEVDAIEIQRLDCLGEMVDAWDVSKAAR